MEKHQSLEFIKNKRPIDPTATLEDTEPLIQGMAIIDQNVSGYFKYWHVDFNATLRSLQTAIKVNAKESTFVGTPNSSGHGATESSDTDTQWHKKYLGTVHDPLKRKDGMDTITINPTLIVGVRDSRPGSWKTIPKFLRKKQVPYPSSGKNPFRPKDVPEEVPISTSQAKNGSSHQANENFSDDFFSQKTNPSAGQKGLMITVPDFVFDILGFASDPFKENRHMKKFWSPKKNAWRLQLFFQKKVLT
ncbi:hypothetical protein [Flagellimonas algicola]|uniref:Uncharacterized protein n=1 Tax=Flagellimonas algicola TaxID=2583815 RepID=A0ABY2WGK9_9FLAO|nr:hypothetical protein [Allomuricauda algicola]TMU50694.1 hypothetical protein FGG15_18000 [Allomuricauda algicola]